MKNSETVCFVSPVPVIMLWDWYWQTFYLFKWPEKLFSCWIYHVWQCDKTHIFNKLTQPQFISQVLSRLEGNILKISRKFLANLKLHILLKDIGTRKRKYFRWTIFRHEHLFKYCNCFHPRHHCKLLFHYTTDSSSLASVHSKSLLKKLYSAPLESCSTYKSMMY